MTHHPITGIVGIEPITGKAAQALVSGIVGVETITGHLMATVTSILFRDTFPDVNGTPLENHTPDVDSVGGGWLPIFGSIDIQSNRANKASSGSAISVADVGKTDMTVTGICNTTSTAVRFTGLIARSSADGTSRFVCLCGANVGATNRIIEDGTALRAFGSFTMTAGQDHTFSVVCSGSTIAFEIDGANTLTYGVAGNGETHLGLEMQGAGAANQFQWDNVEAL